MQPPFTVCSSALNHIVLPVGTQCGQRVPILHVKKQRRTLGRGGQQVKRQEGGNGNRTRSTKLASELRVQQWRVRPKARKEEKRGEWRRGLRGFRFCFGFSYYSILWVWVLSACMSVYFLLCLGPRRSGIPCDWSCRQFLATLGTRTRVLRRTSRRFLI